MKKIAIVPIDNRPVCYELPKQIAMLDRNNEIYMPDKSMMGSLTKNADIDGILNWLRTLKGMDIIIISLDTIAYGGLIPSRRSSDDLFEIMARVEQLKEILTSKNAKVYAFSSIMRISNNNINEEEKEYWSEYGTKIFEYSYNLHKIEKTVKNILKPQYLPSDIPAEIWQDYLNTRKRNFEINKYYIELKKQGLFDTLVFSKDDCAKYGFNVKEAEELVKLSASAENIFIKTGADEIPLTLLSRALNKEKNIKIVPVYLSPYTTDKISKYEDIPVQISVSGQIDIAGAIVSSYNDADLVLIVNNFKNKQGELVMDITEKGFEGELLLPNKPYFIADILNANGADNNLVDAFFKQHSLKRFYGYSAWNTTGNTLGCAIATALTYFNAKYPDKEAFKKLQIIRLLDDWAYQANVRAKIRNNKENLTNGIIKQEMKEKEDIIFSILSIEKLDCEYSFPWNRFFEIGIKLQTSS